MDEKTSGSVRTSVISGQVVLEGEIRGEENLHVFGQIRGSIQITGNILVGKSGLVEAEVEAANITIEGTIRGNALAREHLEILPTGTMIGDIAARSIDIKEGSSFEGRSRMIRQAAPPPAEAEPSPAADAPAEPAEAAEESPQEAPANTESGSES